MLLLPSAAVAALASLLLAPTTALPLTRTDTSVAADIAAVLAPITNLTSGLSLLTFQIDNFQRHDAAARQEIIESLADAQQLAKRISYDALREDEVAGNNETSKAAKRLGDQLRALFGAIEGRRTSSSPTSSSTSGNGSSGDAAPNSSVDAPADARPPGMLPPAQPTADPPMQGQTAAAAPGPESGGQGAGVANADGIVEELYSRAVSLLGTIQDTLPEYFWILVAAT